MKNQFMLALSFAAAALVSAPLSSQTGGKIHNGGVYNGNGAATGCSWYDVNCNINNGRAGSSSNGSWQVAGRDRNGNTVYQRQRVDGNGNVIVETARQDSRGRMVIVNSQVVNNVRRNGQVVYGQNARNCTYKQNGNGNKTKCKYNKNNGNRRGDNDTDGDQDDRYNNNGSYNNNAQGPVYSRGTDHENTRGNGKGHGKHGGRDN